MINKLIKDYYNVSDIPYSEVLIEAHCFWDFYSEEYKTGKMSLGTASLYPNLDVIRFVLSNNLLGKSWDEIQILWKLQ